jgi:hypothetical protein
LSVTVPTGVELDVTGEALEFGVMTKKADSTITITTKMLISAFLLEYLLIIFASTQRYTINNI